MLELECFREGNKVGGEVGGVSRGSLRKFFYSYFKKSNRFFWWEVVKGF